MGWMALLKPGGAQLSPQALFVGAHDPEGRMKLLPAAASGSSALLRAVYVPDDLLDAAASTFTTQYGSVLSVVNGSWWEAAQVYRRWALAEAAWTRSGSLKDRVAAGTLPQWVVDAPVWTRANMDCGSVNGTACVINHAGLCCANKMRDLQKLLSAGGAAGEPPVPLGMHWCV
eukprot:SAG22_NODE_1368_length_4585_cov_2.663174_3_plen_173_part_00